MEQEMAVKQDTPKQLSNDNKKFPWIKGITKEQILDRIKLYEQEKEQVKTAVLAYEGAIQDCRYWLEQLETKVQKNDRQVSP